MRFDPHASNLDLKWIRSTRYTYKLERHEVSKVWSEHLAIEKTHLGCSGYAQQKNQEESILIEITFFRNVERSQQKKSIQLGHETNNDHKCNLNEKVKTEDV